MDPVPFPRTGRPALDALTAAGYDNLSQLNGVAMREVLSLHGMGPKGIAALRSAMAAHGWSFANDDPRVGSGGDTLTSATDIDPVAWVEGLQTARQVRQGRQMLELFADVTSEAPRMWGPSMIGYGRYHYRYPSGREGDAMQTGFSPRKANLVLYVMAPGIDELIDKIGPHRRGASCLYITNLDHIDTAALRDTVGFAWRHRPTS